MPDPDPPACLYQFVPLPTPLRRPEPLAELPAGHYEGYYYDDGEDAGPADAFAGHGGPDETAIPG